MKTRILAPLAGFLILPACAFYSETEGNRLKDEVHGLQTLMTRMQQSVKKLQEQEQTQRKQLAQITKDVGELNKAARRNDADLGVQLDAMMDDVGRMKGRVESFTERVSALEASSSKVQEELDLRFQDLAAQQELARTKSETDKQKAIEQARDRERMLADPKAAFSEAKALLKKKQPVDARKLVREVVLRHKGSRSFKRYLPQSQYLVAETYFAEGKYQQAAAEYNEVRKKYRKSKTYVPKALYKLGQCFEKLDLKQDAKVFYNQVVSSYRRSPEAKLAKARLKKL